MTTQYQQPTIALYHRFLDAMNTADFEEIAKVIDPSFEDHHPGFDIHGLPAYQAALRDACDALQIQGELLETIAIDDKVITRVRLTGKHVGTAIGMPPTGKPVTWTTTEIWRIADGKLVERWAQDDLLGLREQLSEATENVKLVQRVSEAVNARRYDDLDELFAPSFTDRNPAWTVTDLTELKGIIRAAHEGLDFIAHLDDIYPAEGGKVVIHITFTGRHIAPFLGQQPTGRAVIWTSIEVYRIEHGQVAERWVQADTTGLMRQLGVPLP